jgi:hypothetical protein
VIPAVGPVSARIFAAITSFAGARTAK